LLSTNTLTFNRALTAGAGLLFASTAAAVNVAHAEEAGAEQPQEKKKRRVRRVKKQSLYPGKYEDVTKESKDVQEFENFQGGKFGYSKAAFSDGGAQTIDDITKQCIAGVNISMTPNGSSIDYNAQTIMHGGKTILAGLIACPDKRQFILQGRVIMNDVLLKSLQGRATFLVMPDFAQQNHLNLEADWKGSDYATSAKVEFTGRNANVYSTTYIQSLTPMISLGSKLQVIHKLKQGDLSANLGGAIRYSTLKKRSDGECYVGQYEAGTLGMHYVRRVNQALSIASTFSWKPEKGSPFASTQFKTGFLVKQRTYHFWASANHDGKLCSHLETAIMEGSALRLAFCAEYDQTTGESGFGYGLSVGG
jgi:hypothetical protein